MRKKEKEEKKEEEEEAEEEEEEEAATSLSLTCLVSVSPNEIACKPERRGREGHTTLCQVGAGSYRIFLSLPFCGN